MKINTNVSSLAAQRASREHTRQIENTTGKISSGSRVRSAADDAASLAIGTKNKSSIRSTNQAIRNANDAVSEFQIAEGAMNEVGSMLVRLRELSMQASNGHLENTQRLNLNEEYMQLRSEIERIANSTQFMGGKLLKGTQDRDFMVGTTMTEESVFSVNRKDFIVTEFSLGIVDSSIINADEARLNLGYIDSAIEKLAQKRATLGAFQNRLQSAASNLETSKMNESEAASQRMDADLAFETAEKIKGQIKLSASTAVMSQANDFSALTLKLFKD